MTDPIPQDRAFSNAEVLARLEAALVRRAPLHEDPRQTAYRLFHGHGEGVPGLCVDRFGDSLVLTLPEAHAPVLEDLLDLLFERGPPAVRAVARQRGGPRGGPNGPRFVRGAPPAAPPVVLDNGMRFEVELLSPGNAGLYLDARPARAWLLANATGRRVLNLFAYTGSLGLAASVGGARSVMHVEMQKRALRRLKRNLALNGLSIDDRDLVAEDLYRHLRRLGRKARAFEGIVLDPPPQVPGRREGHRPEGQDYGGLVPLAIDVLAPGGWLLCFFSSYRRSRASYEAEVRDASPHALEVIWRGTSGIDFPEDDPERKLRFTAFLRPGA